MFLRASSPQGLAGVGGNAAGSWDVRVWPRTGVWPRGFPQPVPPFGVSRSQWACVAGRASPLQGTINGKHLQVIKKFKQVHNFQKEKRRIKMVSVGTFKIQSIIYQTIFIQQ